MNNTDRPITCVNKAMITVPVEDCNVFSQKIYDRTVSWLPLHQVECTCGKKGCLIRYGHYQRKVKYMSEWILLTVQRVYCKACHRTHAILLSVIVPYSQIPLDDQQEILELVSDGKSPEPVMERNNLIDESNVKYITRQYRRHWEQRLLSIGKNLDDRLVIPCLHAFFRQFMQIHRTRNQLCTATNTS